MNINRVAAVIVTWNKLKDVCFVIDDINKLNLSGINLDIFVVDNASTDGTQAYLEENYPHIQVLQTGENIGGSGGFSHGLNVVSKLEYDYIWLLDNDVRLAPQALLPLVQTLQKYSEVGLVGSQIRKLEQPEIIQEIGSFIYPQKAHLKTNFGNYHISSIEKQLSETSYIPVDVCAAASLLVRREIVQQIGVFENYFLHFDDVEWCLRAKQAGWVVAANPASIVWHSSPDFKQRPWVSYYDERNLCYCWKKHYPHLLLKRIQVLLPKLIYYTLTGRFFWTEIYLQGIEDFFHQVQGKIPGILPYTEYSLEQIIEPSSKVVIEPQIYQDSTHSLAWQQMEINKKIMIWTPSQNIVHRIYIWLISCVSKPVDLTIVNCYLPDIYTLNLAKKIYFFTGTGYILVNWSLINSVLKSLIVLYKITKIYLRMSKLLSHQAKKSHS